MGIEYKQHTVLELFDRHNMERKLIIGVDICKSQYDYYCLVCDRLADFICRWYNLSDIPLKEIDKKIITDFDAYLCTGYDFSPNINFRPYKKREEDARNVFIFCCFTGLPYVDAFNLTYENIRQSFDGKMWIKGKRQKTDAEYQVPLLEIHQI
ncbi:MAG: hypothetical protein LBH04_07100 [Tannerellaceae bacterium]|nr:hypothetical protein [Tannerellaceae bacterium]